MSLISRLSQQTQAWLWGHDDRRNTLRRFLVKSTGGVLLLKIIWQGLGFLTNALLAHLLDLDSYGIYTYVMSWVLVLTIPKLLGLDRLLVRELAIYRAKENWPAIKGLLYYTDIMALVLSVPVIASMIGLSWLALSPQSPVVKIAPDTAQHNQFLMYALWIAALLIPLKALILLRASALQGFHHIVQGQLPDLLVSPALFFLLTGTAALIMWGKLSISLVMVLRVFASLVTLGYSVVLLIRILPKQLSHTRANYDDRSLWFRTIPPMLWLGVTGIILARADFLLLAPLRGTRDVALYGVAYILAQYASLILVVANQSLAPTFAQIHAAGDKQRLQRVVVKSSRAVFLFSAPAAFLLILFGRQALQLFGAQYTHAYTALVILTLGQLFNAAAGSVGTLLVMTGHERSAAVGWSVGAVVNVALNLLLIPTWGIEGAAIANTLTLILWNSILILFVWQKLGIHTTAAGMI